MSRIVIQNGELTGTAYEVQPGSVLGRNPECQVVLQDPGASGRHAQILKEGSTWQLCDLGSSNGTQVNGFDIRKMALQNGDRFSIGATLFQFEVDGAALVATPASFAAPAAKPAAASVAAPLPAAAPAAHKVSHIREAAPATPQDVQLVTQMRERTDAIRAEVGKVIVGQRDVLDQLLMCMIARGHALLIGLPGMAKTLMVQTLASVLGLQFKRIQFTPDLMPGDIIGTEVLETDRATGDKHFRFIQGPVFCNMLLADEINRTPPKTQAALLEAMQERRVTAGNNTFDLDHPFLVLATQNPIEQEGTYPLPEAQLDRFMFNIWVDYPTEQEEESIVGSTTSGARAKATRILTKEEVLQLQDVTAKIPVSPHVVKYAIRLVRATRPGSADTPEVTKKYVSTGAGPRAGQFLVLGAKAMAVLDGRIHISCNDIRRAAIPVLRHRILTNFTADSEGLTSMDIVRKLLEQIPEPGEEAYKNTK
jgi:MoxR-like ATPase